MPPLPRADVERIVAIMRAPGLTAKVSSIHVNGWFGGYDKLAMTRTLMRERFGIDLDARARAIRIRRRFAERRADVRLFPNSVGVANVREFALPPGEAPAYVTQAEAGGLCGTGALAGCRALKCPYTASK